MVAVAIKAVVRGQDCQKVEGARPLAFARLFPDTSFLPSPTTAL
jgi:hypothetical protein